LVERGEQQRAGAGAEVEDIGGRAGAEMLDRRLDHVSLSARGMRTPGPTSSSMVQKPARPVM
jgi:hypothetical protein